MQPDPKRVVRHQVVVKLLRAQAWVLLQEPIDVGACFGDKVFVEHIAENRVAVLIVMGPGL